MRYLFINVTAGYGSTGRIAADQCRALTAQGHTLSLIHIFSDYPQNYNIVGFEQSIAETEGGA